MKTRLCHGWENRKLTDAKIRAEQKRFPFYLFPDWNTKDLFDFLMSSGLVRTDREGNQEVAYWPGADSKSPTKYCEWNWILFFGHTLPTKDAIQLILTHIPRKSRCISVGSGVAFWERLIWTESSRAFGTALHMNCIDMQSDLYVRTWMPVHKCSSNDIDWKKASYNVLFLIWPHYSGYDADVLGSFQGTFLVLIGLGEKDPRSNRIYPVRELPVPRSHRGDLTTFCVGSRDFIKKVNDSIDWSLKATSELPSIKTMNYKPTLFLFQRNKK